VNGTESPFRQFVKPLSIILRHYSCMKQLQSTCKVPYYTLDCVLSSTPTKLFTFVDNTIKHLDTPRTTTLNRRAQLKVAGTWPSSRPRFLLCDHAQSHTANKTLLTTYDFQPISHRGEAYLIPHTLHQELLAGSGWVRYSVPSALARAATLRKRG